MSDRKAPALDIAALIFGENDTAICWVQMPEEEAKARFDTISRDEEGPYLADSSGRHLRIGNFDAAAFDEALGSREFFIYALDEEGMVVDQYGIDAVRPAPANAYGA